MITLKQFAWFFIKRFVFDTINKRTKVNSQNTMYHARYESSLARHISPVFSLIGVFCRFETHPRSE